MLFSLCALNHKAQTVALTAEDVGGEGAAGDPEVVGVVLFVELLHAQVPQSQVSVGGAGHKHLTAGAEGAGHQGRVAHRSSPSEGNSRRCINGDCDSRGADLQSLSNDGESDAFRIGTANITEHEALQKLE